MIGRVVVVVVVAAVVVNHFGTLMFRMGVFKTIYNHRPGPCRLVSGIDMGSEDIKVTKNGLAFISSGVRGKNYLRDPRVMPPYLKGKISLFDFNHPERDASEVPLKGDFEREDFYPVGLSLYEDPKSGETRLFAVNHHLTTDEDRVEIFRFDEKARSLHHLKTVAGENLFSLNSVVAIGPESFYFSNDYYFVKPWLREIEGFSMVAWGSIGFYGDGRDRIVASGFSFANGLNVSPDQRFLYLAQPSAGTIAVLEIKQDNTLEELQTIPLYTGVDNIGVDKQTGDLWLGCHPKLLQWVEYTQNISRLTGSQVLRVKLGSEVAPYDNIDVRQVFMDDGHLVKGSSSACIYGDKLLIGTVIDKMAYCEIKAF